MSNGFSCTSTSERGVILNLLYTLDFLYGAQPVKANSNGCSGNIADIGGTIQYPTVGYYTPNTFCKWNVQTPTTAANYVSYYLI